MRVKKSSLILCLISVVSLFSFADEVPRARSAIVIDGNMKDNDWDRASWKDLSYQMAGSIPDKKDFSGRYKLLWDVDHLYVLAEIVDDVLFDKTADPLALYWDDDCLEVFIDEDHSGGNHLHNFNAFAYHIALDNQTVDMGKKDDSGKPTVVLLNHHVSSSWKRSDKSPNKIVWEVAVKVFNENLKPVRLKIGKKMGFMLAYCDNDGSESREHFMGSHKIKPIGGDKNRGYIDASVFGLLELTGSQAPVL